MITHTHTLVRAKTGVWKRTFCNILWFLDLSWLKINIYTIYLSHTDLEEMLLLRHDK